MKGRRNIFTTTTSVLILTSNCSAVTHVASSSTIFTWHRSNISMVMGRSCRNSLTLTATEQHVYSALYRLWLTSNIYIMTSPLWQRPSWHKNGTESKILQNTVRSYQVSLFLKDVEFTENLKAVSDWSWGQLLRHQVERQNFDHRASVGQSPQNTWKRGTSVINNQRASCNIYNEQDELTAPPGRPQRALAASPAAAASDSSNCGTALQWAPSPPTAPQTTQSLGVRSPCPNKNVHLLFFGIFQSEIGQYYSKFAKYQPMIAV